MRGQDEHQDGVFSCISPEERIPPDHPSIPPERLLRALLLQVFYSIGSERMLMEQLDYDLLFRWFVGMSADERMWMPTVLTKSRERLLKHAVAEKFFGAC
jgi:transposase